MKTQKLTASQLEAMRVLFALLYGTYPWRKRTLRALQLETLMERIRDFGVKSIEYQFGEIKERPLYVGPSDVDTLRSREGNYFLYLSDNSRLQVDMLVESIETAWHESESPEGGSSWEVRYLRIHPTETQKPLFVGLPAGFNIGPFTVRFR